MKSSSCFQAIIVLSALTHQLVSSEKGTTSGSSAIENASQPVFLRKRRNTVEHNGYHDANQSRQISDAYKGRALRHDDTHDSSVEDNTSDDYDVKENRNSHENSVPDSSRNKNNPNLSDNHKADPVVRSFTEPRQNQDEESGTPTSEIPTTFTFEEGDDNDIENSDIDETATSNQGDSQQDDSLQGNTNIAIIRHYSPPQENNVQGDSIFFPFQTSSDNIFSPGRSRQRIPPNARTANMRAVMPNHHFPE
mmetsp:Transcript_20164/g.37684  ORF Transcript_20164/g.37684 Transcript_20164/m.37684 type:complete len:250 (+) Transcript_20164:88-837(+)